MQNWSVQYGFDQRGEFQHEFAHLAAYSGIFADVGPNDCGFGAKGQGFKHGHGGFNAFDAGHITRCGNNAARGATNDNGFVSKLWAIPFFNRRIEGIAVDMGNCELVDLWVAFKPRSPAMGATQVVGANGCKTVAAEAGHLLRSIHGGSLALNAASR